MNSYFLNIQMVGDIEYLSYDEYQVLGKEQWGILSS